MKPYYEADGITIYHGDCREVLGEIDPATVSLLLGDPPYGVKERTDRSAKGRGRQKHQKGAGIIHPARDFAPVYGDDAPFDPVPLLRFPRLVLFGANYFAERLPPSPSWIVWDKRDGTTSDDNADCEMAWTNLGGPARIFRHLWRGLCRASEVGIPHFHPTQKPVAVMSWILDRHTKPGDLVLDPYTGSGPVLVAAKQLGRRAIGIEIEERYCEVAARRLQQREFDFGGAA